MSVPLMTPVTLSCLSVLVSKEDKVPAVSTFISVTAHRFVRVKQNRTITTILKSFALNSRLIYSVILVFRAQIYFFLPNHARVSAIIRIFVTKY